VAIDSGSLKIKSRWSLAPLGAPTALAMDVLHHRLFSAGRNPQMMVVLDSDTGKVLQSFPITAGADAAAYDSESGLIFISTREGMVHVYHEDSPDKFSEAETIKTEFGALSGYGRFWSGPGANGRSSASARRADSGNVSRTGLRTITTFLAKAR
jgi:hypothetical protein